MISAKVDGANAQLLGVGAAALSSAIGGVTTAVTRFVVGDIDPVALAALRFGLGFLLLLPLALMLGARWPSRRDWPAVILLGVLFFALFQSLFNFALQYTTAARGALALSVLPLMTMIAAALLGVERLSAAKALGVLTAMGGVAFALSAGAAYAPRGAWIGDAIMTAATVCMALYNVLSRPFIARSGPLGFVAAGTGAGAACDVGLALLTGGFDVVGDLSPAQWLAIAYLAVFGGVITFYLWAVGLSRATPTQVANAITLNPLTAAFVATLLIGERAPPSLAVGLAAVLAGIWIAARDRRTYPEHKRS
jgi:drug/metabolite transporter (DMT)-like permease